MKVSTSMIFYFFLIGYVIFGLSISAIPSFSKLGFVFVFSGVLFFIVYFTPVIKSEGLPSYFLWYSFFYIFIVFSYIWSPLSMGFVPVGSILTVYLFSTMLFFGINYKLISPLGLVIVFLLPGIINFVAFNLGVNYVSELYDIETEAAMKRFGGLVGHPNAMLSRIMLPLFISILFVKELTKLRLFNKLILPIILLLCIFAMYSSGSKKALLFFIISVPMILSYYPKIKNTIYFISITALSVFLLGGITLMQTSLFDTNLEVINRLEEMLDGDESTYERFDMIFMGIDYFLSSPIFGNGLDSFSYLSNLGYYSHNNLVELLVSGGVIAASLYYFMIFNSLKGYFVNRGFVSLFFLCLLLISFDVTGVTYSDRSLQIFIFLLYSKYYCKIV
ncbi:O-antigen ligase family protein [Shewanella frigidimarina]|uniref:O-antigen ligase family protein n=1 Tax=Shewanella frigidimarina TaxID=56812 RepID=UPI003D7A0C5A